MRSVPSSKFGVSQSETLTHDEEETSVRNNLDGFKMQNLKKPAAIVAVTTQDEEDEFDEMPFTSKIAHKPKMALRQSVPRKTPDTQQLEP